MVGGIVIGMIRRRIQPRRKATIGELDDGYEDQATLHVQGVGSESNDFRTVIVNERIECGRVVIGLGDSVWWQCGKLMWTPKNADEFCPHDTQLELVEHS